MLSLIWTASVGDVNCLKEICGISKPRACGEGLGAGSQKQRTC